MVRRIPEQYYAIGIAVAFGLVGAIGISHHEMWRDEIQAWLIARDSVSLLDLARHLKYEGHPILWYVCLMILTRITRSPTIMQGFHLLIATATVYIFARYSPFNRLQKLLFAFGYFPLYEYGVISRNYGIGVLLLFVSAALFQRRHAKFLWVVVVLSLAAHTSIHVLLIVVAIVAALMADFILTRKTITAQPPAADRRVWLGFILVGLAIIASILQMIPPTDSGYAPGWNFTLSIGHLTRVFNLILRGYFPIPQIRVDFWMEAPLWETSLVSNKVQFVLSAIISAWITLALLRKPVALLIYLLGTIGLWGFFYVKDFGYLRHHGLFFIVFLVALWVAHYCSEVRWSNPLDRLSRVAERSLGPILTLLLIVQLIGGTIAVALDYRYAFSHGRTAAEFIDENGLRDLPILGYRDYRVSTVVGYLDKDQVYYPQETRWGSFVLWNTSRRRAMSDAEIISAADRIQAQRRRDVLLILDHPLSADERARGTLSELARFTGATTEDFYLYRITAGR